MAGMDANERELFERSLRPATASHTGEALDAALDELGWRDALVADPEAAVAALFEAQGAANATSSALDHVVLAALGVEPGATPGLVLPAVGSWAPPGEAAGEGLVIRGLGTAALQRRDLAVVVARTGAADADEAVGDPAAGGLTITVTVPTRDLVLRPVHGLDPELGLVAVAADGVLAATPSPCSASATAWGAAVAAGRRALAHELVGAARTMFQLARDHALDRIQFGRPIASFQAVRHRLADTLVAIEAADAAARAAWDAPSPLTAALAKAAAGRAARLAGRHCQQVLAGIGFTREHPFHRYLQRTLVLDRLLGDANSLTRQVGAELLASRRLPTVLPL